MDKHQKRKALSTALEKAGVFSTTAEAVKGVIRETQRNTRYATVDKVLEIREAHEHLNLSEDVEKMLDQIVGAIHNLREE